MNYQLHKTVKLLESKKNDIVSLDDDDPNHFDPRYFGKNRKYHQPEDYVIKCIIDNLKYLSTITNDLGIEIINAGYDSKLEFFPKVDFESLLDLTERQKKELFEECLYNASGIASISEFERDNQFFEDFDHQNLNGINSFYTPVDAGLKLLNKAIFTHIPVGPFEEKYYFAKRNN